MDIQVGCIWGFSGVFRRTSYGGSANDTSLSLLGAATASRCKLADLFVCQQTQFEIVMQQTLIFRVFVTECLGHRI
jgi:hypothetical protein